MKLERSPECTIDKARRTLTLLKSGETIPMKDLRAPTIYHIQAKHLKNGVPHDPCHCAIANAISDATGAVQVVSLAQLVVYVTEEKGGKVAWRGQHSLSSRAIVEANDMGSLNKAPLGQFMILPPSEGHALKSAARMNKHSKKMRQKYGSTWSTRGKKVDVFTGLRSGRGMKKF